MSMLGNLKLTRQPIATTAATAAGAAPAKWTATSLISNLIYHMQTQCRQRYESAQTNTHRNTGPETARTGQR